MTWGAIWLLLGRNGKTRVRNACEYLKASEWTMRNLHNIEIPFITMHR